MPVFNHATHHNLDFGGPQPPVTTASTLAFLLWKHKGHQRRCRACPASCTLLSVLDNCGTHDNGWVPHLSLLGAGRHVEAVQAVRQSIAPPLGKAEHNGRQQLPAQAHHACFAMSVSRISSQGWRQCNAAGSGLKACYGFLSRHRTKWPQTLQPRTTCNDMRCHPLTYCAGSAHSAQRTSFRACR